MTNVQHGTSILENALLVFITTILVKGIVMQFQTNVQLGTHTLDGALLVGAEDILGMMELVSAVLGMGTTDSIYCIKFHLSFRLYLIYFIISLFNYHRSILLIIFSDIKVYLLLNI